MIRCRGVCAAARIRASLSVDTVAMFGVADPGTSRLRSGFRSSIPAASNEKIVRIGEAEQAPERESQ